MKCQTCSYDDRGKIIKVCGFCEEEAIKQRIAWWQKGKRDLKNRMMNEMDVDHSAAAASRGT